MGLITTRQTKYALAIMHERLSLCFNCYELIKTQQNEAAYKKKETEFRGRSS